MCGCVEIGLETQGSENNRGGQGGLNEAEN